MAYFLFIDEGGQDRRESPCEVLAGVAVRDQELWNLIQALRDAELRHFERYFYFLEDTDRDELGLVEFDELERVQSHLLVEQMNHYFQATWKGRTRASQIIPEPFFVHSELTTGVQLADLVAYILSWGWRLNGMREPARAELSGMVERLCLLRHRAVREKMGNPQFVIWSFALINDLRAREAEGGV